MAEEEKDNQSTPSDSTAPPAAGDETLDEVEAETADETVAAEATAGEPPADEGDTAAEEETAAEAVAEAPAAEETPVEESAPEPEPVAEAAADEEPAGEEPAPIAEAPQEVPRKKKRLPRSQRPGRTKKPREKPTARKPIVRLEKPEHERGRRQERQGTVVSDAMDKTIVVEVDTIKAHPKYKKVVRRSTKFHAHDERNEAKAGDVVRIVETRPLSRQKRWRLAEILEVAQ